MDQIDSWSICFSQSYATFAFFFNRSFLSHTTQIHQSSCPPSDCATETKRSGGTERGDRARRCRERRRCDGRSRTRPHGHRSLARSSLTSTTTDALVTTTTPFDSIALFTTTTFLYIYIYIYIYISF